jgi:hypothetical protein
LGTTSDLLGEELEVHLVQRLGQAVRVVEHHHPAAQGEPTEVDARRLGPAAVALLGGRVVAQQQDVEGVERDAVDHRPAALHRPQIGVAGRVLVARRPPGPGHGRAGRVVGEVADAHEPGLVAPVGGGEAQADGGVDGLLGLDVVHDETDAHPTPSRSGLRPWT